MSEKAYKRILNGFTIINFIYLLITIITSSKAMADDLEHIHASWLVWQGQTPYTDFFEHHHSLMWYLFAPLAGYFSGNTFLFFINRFIIAMVSLATLYTIYRIITDFLADKVTALLAINIFCCSTLALNTLVQFKPDALMQFCFFLGVYFFFRFLGDKQQRLLNLTALFWGISFVFLQTAIFLILPLALSGIYLLYKKEISFKNIIWAVPYALGPIVLYLVFLYANGSLQRYYELNWVVNSHISKEVGGRNIADFSDLYMPLLLGIASFIFILFHKPNKYWVLLFVMYAIELGMRTLYLSPWIYYFKVVLLYNAILISYALKLAYEYYKVTAYAVMVALLIMSGKFWLFEDVDKINNLTILSIATDIAKNTTEKDVVLGTSTIPFGVFNQNAHYYWFSWSYVGKIDQQLFNYAPFDINDIVKEIRPKVIYFEEDLRPNYHPTTRYDLRPELLNKFYTPKKYQTLYWRNDDEEIGEN